MASWCSPPKTIPTTTGLRPGLHSRRLEAVERLILESQQRYPDNLDAGIEHAMQEMHSIISDAEHGNAEAVAEVGCMADMLLQGARPALQFSTAYA
jgi:hypothetical protein